MAIEMRFVIAKPGDPDTEVFVREHKHGVLLCTKRGENEIPVSVLVKHSKRWKRGVVSTGVQHMLNCEMAGEDQAVHTAIARTQKASDLWRAEIESRRPTGLSVVQQFLQSGDYGLSSGYMIYLLTGELPPYMKQARVAYPYDFDSFRRCDVALKTTGLRPMIHKLKLVDPVFGEIVRVWPMLEIALMGNQPTYIEATLGRMKVRREQYMMKIHTEGGVTTMPYGQFLNAVEQMRGEPIDKNIRADIYGAAKELGASIEFPSEWLDVVGGGQ